MATMKASPLLVALLPSLARASLRGARYASSSPLIAAASLAFLLPAVPAQEEEDGVAECEGWASGGECALNPGYMLEHCPIACERQEEVVRRMMEDGVADCEFWARDGECLTNPWYMMGHCPLACGRWFGGVDGKEEEIGGVDEKEEKIGGAYDEEEDIGNMQQQEDFVGEHEEDEEELGGTHEEEEEIGNAQQGGEDLGGVHEEEEFGGAGEEEEDLGPVHEEGEGGVADCEGWASSGECSLNHKYMMHHCPVACKRHEEDIERKIGHINSFFELEARDMNGEVIKFKQFKKKVTVIAVITDVSKCGYTDYHYRGLLELHETFKASPVEINILALPCDQFGEQDPEACPEYKRIARSKDSGFILMDKIDVHGVDAHPVYHYLKKVSAKPRITWKFATYYVVAPKGGVVTPSSFKPKDIFAAVLDAMGAWRPGKY